ncbi:MAG TPA: glycosyl hydrolase family 65 protein [Frankiaceae bacterium]|nr:glycosyl hydrolase family 65 protein [Frankiaceae bacterium]
MTVWRLRYAGLDPGSEGLREVLCALGNGRWATRGAAPECRADGVHYPATYAAGVFNRLRDTTAGREIENESIVNLPDWQSLAFRPDDGDWVDLAQMSVSHYVQELDLRRGILTRRFHFKDSAGRRTAVAQRRAISMADPYLACLDSTFVALNWSGRLVVRSGIDGRVANAGVLRYQGLSGQHLLLGAADAIGDDAVALDVETTQSRVRISIAARHRVLVDDVAAKVERHHIEEQGYVGQELLLEMQQGERHTVEKVATMFTSRDQGISEPSVEAREKVRCLPELGAALSRHVLAWDHLWTRCDLEIHGHERTALILHLHLFHLLQTLSEHSVDIDVGIPARGLHGEAYRGHVFWDAMFVHPYLNLRMPELSRTLLMYRWRRLPQARRAAHEIGCRGACFPWQSGSNGREESQTLHLNPRSGRWLRDNSHLQRHISAAVAYSAWQYYEATGDMDFLGEYAAELILEVAKFFSSLATYDRVDDRYDVRGVMGPDEYHDAYPWKTEPGIDNNAYTNLMVVWVLTHALDCLRELPTHRRQQLLDLLDVSREELERWEHISRKMRLCWHGDGILSQFEGYERLEELPWGDYTARYGDVSRLDRILEAEGDTTNRYRLSKQADALMLFYVLSEDQIRELVERLGYSFDPNFISRNIEYYLDRTAHGSTLSKLVHSWALARSDRPKAWDYFLEALRSDIDDSQGGTTAEGIHLGAMAGTIDLLQRGFTGLDTRDGQLWLDPYLPDALSELSFRVRYREHHGIQIRITHDRLIVSGRRQLRAPLRLRVRGTEYDVDPSGTREVSLRPASSESPTPTLRPTAALPQRMAEVSEESGGAAVPDHETGSGC